ncbi:MAG: hypothetical protein WBO11_10095 [Nitrospira sp.]
MKSVRGESRTSRSEKNGATPDPVARKAAAGRREQHKDAVTAAMEESQRRGSAGAAPQVSAALMRAVEAVKRQQKKQGITQEWDLAQRRTETEDPTEFAHALGRAVEAAERARKKQVITRAIAKSQRG